MTEQQKNRKAATSRTTKNINNASIIAEETTDNTTPQVVEINQSEVEKQLKLLGYKKGDTVYLRGFLPSNHPDKSKHTGRKAAVKNLPQLIKTAGEWQAQGLGVYLVVNGGGHTDSGVKECRAIFYEHDNLDKNIQFYLWDALGLPAPTFQVDTGGKSIHSYWVFEEPFDVELWRTLQTDLLEYADADRALKNPSRVMRLAGCKHGSGNESKIISESGNNYQFLEIRNIIPSIQQNDFLRKQAVSQPRPQPQSHDINDWGDMRKISAYLEGYCPGGRKGWITCKCPVHNGQSNDSLHVNESTGQFHCHHGCDNKEIFKVSLDIAKRRGYVVPELKGAGVRGQESGVTRSPVTNHQSPKTKPQTSKTELITELTQVYDRELPKSELEALFPEIAERHGRSSSEVRRIYDALSREKNLERDRLEVKEQIPEIIQAQQARLDPKQLFWGDGGRFADLLQRTADAMPTSVENLITTLIPVAGSRIGTAARIIINPTARYTQPAIYWSCVVAPTGRLKTPAQEVIISPLAKLEADEFRKWKIAKEDFDEELKRYKKNSDEEPPEPPAPRKRFLVQGATAETRIKLHSENPRGLLNYRDEWSSFINGRNKYRNGKGDDLELDLSEFNGNAILKDNSSENLFLERSSISRTGNTQPETLQKFLAATDYEDYTGEFARWLFCLVPGDVAYLELFRQGDNAGEELDLALTELYRRLGRFEEQDYFLTDGAKGVFQSYHRWLTDAEVAETHPGLRAAYPKLKSYLARLALWLHIVNSALSGCSMPPQFIEGGVMYQATYFVNFFLNQAKLLYSSFGREEGKITAELLKVKEYIEKHSEGCTHREIKYGILCLRKAQKAEVEALCKNLLDLKMIRFEDKKYYPLQKIDHHDHHFSETPSVQDVEHDDQRSSLIIIDHHFSEKFENSENLTQVQQNSVNTECDITSTDDHDDQMMINDHHLQSYTQQEFSGNDDHDDQFSLETEKNISEGNTTDAIQNEDTKDSERLEIQGFAAGDQVVHPVKTPLDRKFPLGSWVRYNSETGSKLAQVVGYSIEDCLDLDGRDKSSIFGVYRAADCDLVEQVERLQLGLSTKLQGRDLTRCPEFIVGQYYWSRQENKRVKLTTVEENTVAKFKSPEVLVMPDGGVPTRLKLDDLVCVYESPAPDLKAGDIVNVWVENKRGEKITKLGGVTRVDFQGVWVKFPLKGDNWTNAQKFYAHRVVKVE